MSCGWMLVLVSQVLLLLLCAGHSRCANRFQPDAGNSGTEKRYDDIDYDSFIGLMGRRSTGPNRITNTPFRPNMNDIFVGLLGRRNTKPAIPAWREERRGNLFLKDRRLRYSFAVPYEA